MGEAGMTGFDAAAASAAYIASISPATLAKATAYTQSGHWLLLGQALVSMVAALIILRLGLLAWVEAKVGAKRTFLAAAGVSVIYSLFDAVLELPWTWYAGWKRETDFGMSHQPLGDWFSQLLLGDLISAVFMGIFLGAVYVLIRKTGRRWWVWASGVTAVFIILSLLISPIVLEPLFNSFKPAPAGPVRDAVVALAQKAQVPSDRIFIYNGSRQSDRYTANMAGLFGSARIALSDTMFRKGADLAEIRAVVGHEIGHYAHAHAFWLTLLFSGISLITFFAVDRLFDPVSRRLGSDLALADPASLPVLSIISSVAFLVLTPVISSGTRLAESDADQFSFHVANEPDGFARAMLKTVDYRAPSPSALEEALFYDHPSISHRITAAMEWKAAHLEKGAP